MQLRIRFMAAMGIFGLMLISPLLSHAAQPGPASTPAPAAPQAPQTQPAQPQAAVEKTADAAPQPDQPPTESPAEKNDFEIVWRQSTWGARVDVQSGKSVWDANLTGSLRGPQDIKLVGFIVDVEQSRDSAGRSLLPTDQQLRWATGRRNRSQEVHRLIGRRSSRDEREIGAFQVELGGSTQPVDRIMDIRGTVYLLQVEKEETIDLPLNEVEPVWHATQSGVKFRVESSLVRGQQITLQISHTMGEEPVGDLSLWSVPYVYQAALLTHLGAPIDTAMASFGARDVGNMSVTLFAPNGLPSQPGSLRLHIATEVREQRVPFEFPQLDLGLHGDRPNPAAPAPKPEVEE